MKKYLVLMAAAGIMAACGNNDTATNETDSSVTADNTTAEGDLSQNPDYAKGLELIGASDCFTCHKTEEKLVGPAYVEVANKYAGSDTALAYLSHKIITGGSGVWGDVAMTPHPQLSQDQAEQMAKYILLLKNK